MSLRALIACALATWSLSVPVTSSFSRTEKQSNLGEILVNYRTGDADQAIRALSEWPVARVDAADPSLDQSDRFALGLLMLEAADAARNPNAGIDLRSRGVNLVADFCIGEMSDAALAPLCRDALRLVVSSPGRDPDIEARVFTAFPDDALLRLAAGALHEYWMLYVEGHYLRGYDKIGEQPWSPSRPPTIMTSHGRVGMYEESHAEGALRQALAIDPGLSEARLRLGRVLWTMDSYAEAADAWRKILADPHAEPRSAYLSGLFLGQLYEAQSQPGQAEATYRLALQAYPSGQSVRAALGAFLLESGREHEAWDLLSGAVHHPGAAAAPDPWVIYPGGDFWWRRGEILKALRSALRK